MRMRGGVLKDWKGGGSRKEGVVEVFESICLVEVDLTSLTMVLMLTDKMIVDLGELSVS